MTYVFFMGVLLGLRHALDADHIAAVAALATRVRSVRETVRVGFAWGVGHAFALFAAAAVVIALDFEDSGSLAVGFEFLVGAMLVVLGLDVIRRVIRDRVHAHAHRHAGHDVHVHVHSHAGASGHGEAEHAHGHPFGLSRRAAFVGLMHGLAGSAALLLISVGAMETVAYALAYVTLFGLGSILGMAALSLTIALPLRLSAKVITSGYNAIHAAVGLGTIVLGGMLLSDTAAPAAALFGLA
jgi:hypothetical protein